MRNFFVSHRPLVIPIQRSLRISPESLLDDEKYHIAICVSLRWVPMLLCHRLDRNRAESGHIQQLLAHLSLMRPKWPGRVVNVMSELNSERPSDFFQISGFLSSEHAPGEMISLREVHLFISASLIFHSVPRYSFLKKHRYFFIFPLFLN